MEDWESLMHHIKDEVADAKRYIKDALDIRATDPETADTYYRLSGEELREICSEQSSGAGDEDSIPARKAGGNITVNEFCNTGLHLFHWNHTLPP